MNKHFQFFCFVAVLLGLAFASNAQNITYTVVSSSNSDIVVNVQFPEYHTTAADVNGESMFHLGMKQAYPLLEAGAPEMLQSSFSVIIPEGSRPTAEIVSADYQLVNNFNLAPSKGKLYRNVDPATVPYQKGAAYLEDRFLYNDTVALGDPYQLRDFSGVAVHCYPFAYNPVQKTLKVYQNITLRIHLNSNRPIVRPERVAKPFDAIYADHFLNYTTFRSTPLADEGDMLIIAPQEFCAAMQPYVEWKNKTGYATELVELETVGTTYTAVKNYITDYYNSHNLVYVLIVGDDNKFPAYMMGSSGWFSSQYAADNCYGEIVGNDVYPDLIVGKISAETVAHVTTQVERFIQYEQNPPETDHFPVFLGIASTEGGSGQGDNGEIDYEHIRNIGNILSGFTYTSGYEVFDGSQGGMDQAGATAAQVSAAVNSGVGIINYCGHGSETSWSTTNFSVSNVNNLTNNNRLPFIISTACVNGDYLNRTCFAEAWVRATNNGQPTGAVSTLMSSVNQSWDPPMCGQDRMVEHITGANNRSHLVTFGSITFNGIIHMLDEYNDDEVSRTWLLFGDPTLAVRTAVPEELPLTYSEMQPVGNNNITFSSTVENAKVTLTKHGEIVATGRIQNGSVNLDISALPTLPDTLTVVAWAQNYIPFEGSLYRIHTDRPYVMCTSIETRDNNNNFPETGEQVTLNLQVKNVGQQTGNNIQARVISSDPYVTLSNNSYTINSIAGNQTLSINNTFTMHVSNNVPAYHRASLVVRFVNGTDTTNSSFSIELGAPELYISSITVDDSENGNNDGVFNYGETVNLNVMIGNRGNASAANGHLRLHNYDERLTLSETDFSINSLAKDATRMITLTATIDTSVNQPTMFGIHAYYTADHYSADKIFRVTVGTEVENWESNDFSSFNWNVSGSNPWIITSQNVYEGSFAARSAQIGDNASSTLQISHSNEVADTLSFYFKVSSEDTYDFLNFYIDNVLKDQWSGEVGWEKTSYLVPAGTHTFKWVYKKDMYMDSGSDMAMIDCIKFPCLVGPTSVQSHTAANIQVQPNPTTNFVQINLDEELLGQDLRCELYDLTGRLVRQNALIDELNMVDLTDFTSGLYIMKVLDNHKVLKTFKIVKQ